MKRLRRRLVTLAATSALVIAIVVFWPLLHDITLQSDGYVLVADGVVSLERATSDDAAHGQISVRNPTGASVRVVGATVSCPCVRLPDLPLAIEPHTTAQLEVDARPIGTATQFEVQFRTDPGGPLVKTVLHVTGDAKWRQQPVEHLEPTLDPMFQPEGESDD